MPVPFDCNGVESRRHRRESESPVRPRRRIQPRVVCREMNRNARHRRAVLVTHDAAERAGFGLLIRRECREQDRGGDELSAYEDHHPEHIARYVQNMPELLPIRPLPAWGKSRRLTVAVRLRSGGHDLVTKSPRTPDRLDSTCGSP